ncbi:hypothetical protein GCM10027418_23080 [Mariniluteicoccus endophyticus]
MRVALVTSAQRPNLDEDGPRLLAACESRGLEPHVVAWDSNADWCSYAATVIRSTWDYTERIDEFLAWTRIVPKLMNDADTVAWNSDKRYLQDLAAAGIPTVPTRFVPPGGELPSVDAAEIVVKPAISASAKDTARFTAGDPAAADLLAEIGASDRYAMVQPYLTAVDTEGEASLVYFDGHYSHASTKAAVLSEADGERVTPRTPTSTEDELGRRVLAYVSERFGTPLYARIDMLPTPDGPVLLEAELIEPSLWLREDEYAVRLVEAIGNRA